MRVFVYEFVTGGGWFSHGEGAAPDSLVAEGRAMRDAVVADFAAIEGAAVEVTCDVRQPPVALAGVVQHMVESEEAEARTVRRLAAAADWTVVIAPEFEGHLLRRVEAVKNAGGRLLGPAPQFVALAADKHAAAVHLAGQGIRAPGGMALAAGAEVPEDFPFPAVLKPRDGAGSLGVEYLGKWPAGRVVQTPSRLEEFCPGTAASVGCLCGPDRVVPLVPCRQHLAGQRDFAYRGGSLPLEDDLADRARRLAARAVESLPGALGYVGVDLVLGVSGTGCLTYEEGVSGTGCLTYEEGVSGTGCLTYEGGDELSGAGDAVIEINPRLTTSYVGLRAAAAENLAATMIAVARGREVRLCWKSRSIHFTSSGRVTSAAPRVNP